MCAVQQEAAELQTVEAESLQQHLARQLVEENWELAFLDWRPVTE
jgi:hypothetical protein